MRQVLWKMPKLAKYKFKLLRVNTDKHDGLEKCGKGIFHNSAHIEGAQSIAGP